MTKPTTATTTNNIKNVLKFISTTSYKVIFIVYATTSPPIISMICKHNSHILNIAPDMLRCYTIFLENYELVCLNLCKLCILVWSEQHIQEEGDDQERYNRSYTKCTCCNEHTNLIYNE